MVTGDPPRSAPDGAGPRRIAVFLFPLLLLLLAVSALELLPGGHEADPASSAGRQPATSPGLQAVPASAPSGGVPSGAAPSGAAPTAGNAGGSVAEVAAADFQISGDVASLVPGQTTVIPLTLTNPNSAAVYVTSLTVSVSADSTPSGCRSADNLGLIQSSASGADPIVIPALGSVILETTPRAPQITLLNLPGVNQDVCKNSTFVLTYAGSARW